MKGTTGDSKRAIRFDTRVDLAVILAGGLGTRLRDVLQDLPKAMAPINGRPFLEYQLDYWIQQGIRHFILSVGYQRETIMKHFGEKYRNALIEYSVETTPLGTGGGLLLAVEKLDKHRPFLLLNGDTFFEVLLTELTEFHIKRRSDWTFSLFQTVEKKRYMGMKVDAEGRILSLRAESGPLDHLANGGVYLVNPELLASSIWTVGAKLSLEDDILPTLFVNGARFYGHASSRRFIDIGLPEDFLRSREILTA